MRIAFTCIAIFDACAGWGLLLFGPPIGFAPVYDLWTALRCTVPIGVGIVFGLAAIAEGFAETRQGGR
jgi:hypothetical protein